MFSTEVEGIEIPSFNSSLKFWVKQKEYHPFAPLNEDYSVRLDVWTLSQKEPDVDALVSGTAFPAASTDAAVQYLRHTYRASLPPILTGTPTTVEAVGTSVYCLTGSVFADVGEISEDDAAKLGRFFALSNEFDGEGSRASPYAGELTSINCRAERCMPWLLPAAPRRRRRYGYEQPVLGNPSVDLVVCTYSPSYAKRVTRKCKTVRPPAVSKDAIENLAESLVSIVPRNDFRIYSRATIHVLLNHFISPLVGFCELHFGRYSYRDLNAFVKVLLEIEANPELSFRKLSQHSCRSFDWSKWFAKELRTRRFRRNRSKTHSSYRGWCEGVYHSDAHQSVYERWSDEKSSARLRQIACSNRALMLHHEQQETPKLVTVTCQPAAAMIRKLFNGPRPRMLETLGEDQTEETGSKQTEGNACSSEAA